MTFARRVFFVAGLYGILVLLPQYFLADKVGRDFPPAITHPEFYYGFIGVALAWQVLFFIIAKDPVRYRLAMLAAVIEKVTFGAGRPAAVMRLILLLTVLGFPSLTHAQTPARLSMLDAWDHQRKHILAVIDSATPEMLGFRTTKGVRTFAEQIDHIAGVAAIIVGRAVAGTPVPKELAGDTAVYLHDKAQLRIHADRYFGFVIGALSGLTDDQLAVDQPFAGGTMPKWRWNLTALQHSAWTLGQLVPYLRMNNRIPPQFTPF